MAQRILQSPEVVGIAQVMAAAFLWGTVGIAAKMLPQPGLMSQELLGLLRLAIGGPALILFLLLLGRRAVPDRMDPVLLAGFAIGCATFQISLFHAFDHLGVTVTVLLTVCLPPMISTGLSLLRRDRGATRGTLSALGLASLGLAVFAMEGIASGGASLPLPGLGLAVLGSVAFVVMTAAARRLTQRANPLAVAGIGLTLSALVLFGGAALFDPQALLPAAMPDGRSVAVLLYLGLGPTALAYVLYCRGVARCRSANLGLVASMVEPAFAMLLAWFLLAERLSLAGFAGCALVLLGMATLLRSERRQVGARMRVPVPAART